MIEEAHLDADLRPLDRLGRVQLHRLNIATWIKAIPGFMAQFQPVPTRYYAGDRLTFGMHCPCGEDVTGDVGSLTPHEGCSRIYLYTGRYALVANSPTSEEVAIAT